ncbi:GGDEF domain-containing protein [Xanthobacter autotrophicus DSM 431]|uniref:GGDEF domain-containing protein n=1 Tax=Xanthobacter nonsaccharivorans TaxID=3119912 RepID=UPI00372782D1
MTEGRLYIFAGPAVSLIIAVVFLLVWIYQRERRYVLYFAIAFFAYALALLSQVLSVPRDVGQNTIVSAIIYTFAIFSLVEGVLARFGKTAGPILFIIAGGILALLYYFFYFDRNLVARIYVQNFGYGLLFLVAAGQIGVVRQRRLRDQLLFWAFALFGVQFFVRTVATMSVSDALYEIDRLRERGVDPQLIATAFRESAFWQVLNFTILISAFLIALILLATVAFDMIDEMRREREVDPLTGMASRDGLRRRAAELFTEPAGAPVCVVYCSIDHLKAISDTYGPVPGDRVLQAFSRLLVAEASSGDVAARLGGDAFALLLTRTNKVGAELVAERVHAEMGLTRFSLLPAHVTVTASFGVAERRPGEELLDLLERAAGLAANVRMAGGDGVVTERDGAQPARDDEED